MTAELRCSGLVAGYEPGLDIVKGVDLACRGGSITALLGPNGAGKSTLVKAMAGLVPVRAGAVLLDGRDLGGLPAHERAAAGLAFVPQTENVFARMSVVENLEIAAAALPRSARPARIGAMFAQFPDLAAARTKAAGRLSGGQRQMLALARALIVAPRALLLDEPFAGLAPRVVDEVGVLLRVIARSGPAILLVEQQVDSALRLADDAVVLVEGEVRRQAPAADLLAEKDLSALFMGLRAAA